MNQTQANAGPLIRMSWIRHGNMVVLYLCWTTVQPWAVRRLVTGFFQAQIDEARRLRERKRIMIARAIVTLVEDDGVPLDRIIDHLQSLRPPTDASGDK